MAKVLKSHEAVTINNNGINTALSCGYKMAFIAIEVENEEGAKLSGVTLSYKGFAQSFACVVNDGNSLYGYALPVTTVAGLFANKELFAIDENTTIASNSALISRFDNGKVFRNIKPLNSFVLVASATGKLFDRRKNKAEGKEPPMWSIWGVKALTDDKPEINGSTISWGGLTTSIEDVAEKIAKSHDALCDRLNG